MDGWMKVLLCRLSGPSTPAAIFFSLNPMGNETKSASAVRGNIVKVFLMIFDLGLVTLALRQSSHLALCIWVEECTGLQRAH